MAGRPLAARLSVEQVVEARRRHRNGESIRALAREFGVAHSTLAAHMRAAEQAESAAAVGAAALTAASSPTPQPRTDERGAGAHERALAEAAAAYVERLEAAYQQAFVAIETLLGAIERVRELRSQENGWKEANRLGLAPPRPEPWRVRVGHDAQLRALDRRFTDAVNSRW